MTRTAFATRLAAVLVASPGCGLRASYDYYLAGNSADVAASTRFGLALGGGGTDVDALFTWMSERAGGGDLVVIRASGADGYNHYALDLGGLDSVETLVLKNRAASSAPFVLEIIRNADALFIAGGDQSHYVANWKGTPVEKAIQELAARGVPIGGTSAGTAVLGEFVYSGRGQMVTSAEALANPFSRNITLDRGFLQLPGMGGVITDQHFVERDRMGRTLAFMARIVGGGWAGRCQSMAIDRETAILVDETGQATVVARAGHPTPYAYFLSAGQPAVVAPRRPLTYRGIQVERAQPGSTFDLHAWTGTGLTSYTLNVEAGAVSSTQPGGSIY
jgi:cyanophycinase